MINELVVHITKQCNYRCKQCYLLQTNFNDVIKPEFAINAIKEYDPVWVRFYGGEPTLHSDIIQKIINEFPNKKFAISSNGTLLKDDLFDRMDEIYFTVETFIYSKQNSYRKFSENHFNNLLRNIKKYKNKISAIHNVYPKENDTAFFKFAELLNLNYSTYPIIMDTEEFDPPTDEVINHMNLKLSPLKKPPRLRCLEDGTITYDMSGLIKNNKELPVHKKCLLCKDIDYCPSVKMFPHFCNHLLEINENKKYHFCRLAEYIHNLKA